MAVLVAAGAVSLAAHAQCNIYMGANQQVIGGCGFSSAWCGQLAAAKNNALYNALGMSLLRNYVLPQYYADFANWLMAAGSGEARFERFVYKKP